MDKVQMQKLRFAAGGAILVSALAAWSPSMRAAHDGSEGDEWMKWDRNARQTYVRAYVQGMVQGFNRGCDEGVSAARPESPGKAVAAYISACLSHSPISPRDSMKMVGQITDFYTKYPSEHTVTISEVLLSLHTGQSLEQIHEHFAGSQRQVSPAQ